MLFEPFYGYHYNTIKALGLKPLVVPLNRDEDWSINYEQIRGLITPATRAIVINTPANPTGKVFTREEISQLGHIAQEYDLLMITDEIYEYITYDTYEHVSPAALPEIKERVITIGGFSKTFSITGWRIAYICGPADFISRIGVLNDLFYICAPAPLRQAVAEGLEGISPDYYKGLRSWD